MSKITLHHLSGDSFHGRYSFVLRGPADGFLLSASQRRKAQRAVCSYGDCQCPGGNADRDTAFLQAINFTDVELVSAARSAAISLEASQEEYSYWDSLEDARWDAFNASAAAAAAS